MPKADNGRESWDDGVDGEVKSVAPSSTLTNAFFPYLHVHIKLCQGMTESWLLQPPTSTTDCLNCVYPVLGDFWMPPERLRASAGWFQVVPNAGRQPYGGKPSAL